MDERYIVSKFDNSTYQVFDTKTEVEFCVCTEFEEQSAPAEVRAKLICNALNYLVQEKSARNKNSDSHYLEDDRA